MGDLIERIWYFIALLPFFMFQEGSNKFAKLLKDRGIYDSWDMWHSGLVFLILLAIFLYHIGFRP